MIQYFRRKSILWSLFSGFVLVALTGDAINIDDLASGVYVIHDLGDDTHPDLAVSFSLPGRIPEFQRSQPFSVPSHRLPGNSDRATKLVLDEDGPSEPATSFSSSLLATDLNLDVQSSLPNHDMPTSALHLLNRTFLI